MQLAFDDRNACLVLEAGDEEGGAANAARAKGIDHRIDRCGERAFDDRAIENQRSVGALRIEGAAISARRGEGGRRLRFCAVECEVAAIGEEGFGIGGCRPPPDIAAGVRSGAAPVLNE